MQNQTNPAPLPLTTLSGKEHLNSMLVRAPLAFPGAQHWTAVFKYDPSIQLKGLTCFSQHVVLHGRQGGVSQLWVYMPSPAKLAKGEAELEAARVRIPHPEPVYCAYGGSNHNFKVRNAGVDGGLAWSDGWLGALLRNALSLRTPGHDVPVPLHLAHLAQDDDRPRPPDRRQDRPEAGREVGA